MNFVTYKHYPVINLNMVKYFYKFSTESGNFYIRFKFHEEYEDWQFNSAAERNAVYVNLLEKSAVELSTISNDNNF